jgi:hypothetical protein
LSFFSLLLLKVSGTGLAKHEKQLTPIESARRQLVGKAGFFLVLAANSRILSDNPGIATNPS